MKKYKIKNRRYKKRVLKPKKKSLQHKEISYEKIKNFLYTLDTRELIGIQNIIIHLRYERAKECGVNIGYTPITSHF